MGGFAAGIAALCFSLPATAAEPIVVGQSLNMGPDSDGGGLRMQAAAKGYFDALNASGGVRGRRVELISLNDDGDPRVHARNLRELVASRGAVALLNCQDEASCVAAAAVTQELKVPMVGVYSGVLALGRDKAPWLFRVRADLPHEVDVLARQLRAIACFRVVLVTDTPDAEAVQRLREALGSDGMSVKLLVVPPGLAKGGAALLAQLEAGQYHAAVLSIRLDTAEALIDQQLSASPAWPRVIASLSSNHLQTLIAGFKNRMFGFTSVVPNPEAGSLRLSQEFLRTMNTYGAGHAVTFLGLESYINASVLAAGLRRTERLSPEALAGSLANLSNLDLGGYSVSFAGQRAQGSDWVDVGVRSRSGVLLH